MMKKYLGILVVVAILMTFVGFSVCASEPMTLTVSEQTAKPGDTVAVTVSVAENPGLASLKFYVAYDSMLTLTGVTFDSAFGTMVTTPEPYANPQPLSMISPLSDVTANGVFATLTFKVADNAPAGHKANVSVTYSPDDICNGNYDNVPVNVTNGGVTVASKEKLKISGASLVLQSNLAISYQVNKSLFEEHGYSDPRLEVVMNGVKTTITDYDTIGEKYVFVFRNIAPNKMNDTASATLYATYDGEACASTTRDYSVATYCYNMLGREQGDEFRTMLVDLLNYGAASQVYTSYRTDALVNANLTDAQRAWGTSQLRELENALDTKYVKLENPTAKWKGAALYLQDAVTIQLQLEATDLTDVYVKVTNDKNQTWTIPASQFESLGNNRYFAYFSGLDAGQMRDYVYLTIYKGNTAISNTARYSICSYAYSKQNDTEVPGLADLVKAMMKYGDAAYAFAN